MASGRGRTHMSGRRRWITCSLLVLGTLAVSTGCEPARTQVPWWRGIPSNFMAKNSLEAEAWRIQHRGPPPAEPELQQYVVHAPLAAGSSTATSKPTPAGKDGY